MGLNVEALLDDVRAHLQRTVPAALAALNADGRDSRYAVPPPKVWYVGEWSPIRAYELPAGFVTPARSTNRGAAPGGAQLHDNFLHALYVAVLCEGTEEEALTRAVTRLAEATYTALHDREIVRAGAARKVIAQVPTVDWGPILARKDQNRIYSKDATLSVTLNHHENF